MNPDDNPFWGEPTPTDLWDDMKKLNTLYEALGWDHRDYWRLPLKIIILLSEINQERVGRYKLVGISFC